MSKCGLHHVRDIVLVVTLIAALDIASVFLGLLPKPAMIASCKEAITSVVLDAGHGPQSAPVELPVRKSRDDLPAGPWPGARLLRPMGQAHYQFVHFSAYRESFTTFYVIGLSSRITRQFDKPVYACLWLPAGEAPGSTWEVNTTADVDYIRHDEHVVPYGVVVVKCPFDREVGADDLGGLLSLTVSSGPPVGQVQRNVVLREEAGTRFAATRAGPFPHKYGFCSPPIVGNIHQSWIQQWLIYHLSIMNGQAHFFLYNVGGINDEGRTILEPFVKAGFVTITDVVDDELYPSWYHAQVLMLNDCLHRTRFVSDWTLFYDFDEFIYLQPPHTLAGLLEENADASVLTLGSWPVGTTHCRAPKSKDEWKMQRMVFKKKLGPECKKPEEFSIWFCPQQHGRRKMVVNPLKVFSAAVHRAVQPMDQERHLNASIVRLDHFRGALAATARLCTVTWNLSVVAQDVYDALYVKPEETLSEAMALARESVPRLYLQAGPGGAR